MKVDRVRKGWYTILFMAEVNKVSEALGIALTGARYLLAERMAKHVKNDELVALDMAMIVVADIFDGVLLRKFDLDTPNRRLADGIVDHMTVARVASEVAKKNEASRPYIGILAARAAVVGALNAEHLRRTGEVTKGQVNQKATNLAMAAFGLAAASGNKRLTHLTGGIASGVAVATAFAHTKGLGENHPGGIRKL